MMKHNKGWRGQSKRHSKAAKGIKTGRKNYGSGKLPKHLERFAKEEIKLLPKGHQDRRLYEFGLELNKHEQAKKSLKKNYGASPEYDEEKFEELEREHKENQRRRKYGLEDLDEERLSGFGDSSSTIIKEKNGLALIRHHDLYSPASESPIMFEIKDDKGNITGIVGIGFYYHFN